MRESRQKDKETVILDYLLPNCVSRGQMKQFQFKTVNIMYHYYYREGQNLLTICRQKELCCVLLRQPSNLVDLLFDLKAFQVIKLRLVALEGAVNIVLSSTLRLILTLNRERPQIRVSPSIITTELRQQHEAVFQFMYDQKIHVFFFP